MLIIFLSIFFAIMLQASVTTVPLVLLIILFLSVVFRNNDVFFIAFFSGMFLDLLTLGRFGISSLYFTILVFIVYTYQKRFEIETLHFITIFSFLGSVIYLFLIGSGHVFFQSVLATVISASSFITYKRFNKKAPKYA